MFGIIILFLEILGYTLALRLFLNVPLAAGPAVYASAIMLALYASDFVGGLGIASWLIHAAGILALLASMVVAARSPPDEFQLSAKNVARGAALLLAAVLAISFLYLMNERARFERTDEFSHWGTIIRAVYEAGTFHFHPNPLYFQDYPPGVSLFNYHLLVLTGYSEGLAFFACAVLMLCLSFGAFALALRSGIVPFLFACYLLHCAVTALGPGWSSVLIDHLLGAGFAAGILTCCITREGSKGLFAVPVVLGALVLLKSAGMMLALLAATIGTADLLIIRLAASGGLRKMRLSVADFGWIGAMFVTPLIVNWTWRAYVVSEGLNIGWSGYSPFDVVQQVLACCGTSREIEVATKFFAQFFKVSPAPQSPASLFAFLLDALSRISLSDFVRGPRPPGMWMGTLFLAGAAMVVIAPTRLCRLRISIVSLLLFLGFLAYSASILLAYLYSFSDFEGRVLISFYRYLDVFLLGWLLVNLGIFALLVSAMPRPRNAIAWCAIAISGALAIKLGGPVMPPGMLHPATVIETVRSLAAPPAPYREEVSSFTDRIKPHIPKDAKIYILWQRSNGLHLFVAKYELLPHFTNLHCWSLGAAPDLGMTPCRWPVDELSTRLAKFDYIAIGKGLQELRQQYPAVFSGGPADADGGLYRIKILGNRLSLSYVTS